MSGGAGSRRSSPPSTAADSGGLRLPADGVERVTRLIFLVIGVSGLVFSALSLEAFLAQVRGADAPVIVAFWILVFGLPVAMGILSLRGPLRTLRLLALAEGVVFVLALTEWLTVHHERMPVVGDVPWVITLTAIPAVCVASSARPAIAWAYVVLVSGLSGWIRAWTSAAQHASLVGLQDSLYALLLLSVFVGLTMAMLRGGHRVTDAAAADRQAYSESASRLARKHERLTIDALVHDSVISVLLMAGRGVVSGEARCRHARRTLEKIDALDTQPAAAQTSVADLDRRLRDLTAEVVPDAGYRSSLPDAPHATLPANAAEALLDAAGEAMRNARLHANPEPGKAARVWVDVQVSGSGVEVGVRDEGVGFSPADVPAERLGISRSIFERMASVDGGAALQSQPGSGTEVRVSWNRRLSPPVPPEAGPEDGRQAFTTTFALLAPVVRVILALFIVVHGVLAFGGPERVSGFPLSLLAFLAVSAAAIWSMRIAVNPLPWSQTLGTVSLLAVTEAAMYVTRSPSETSPFAQWHLGAMTLVLLILAMRGRPVVAWLGYLGMAVATTAWALDVGLTVAVGVDLVIRHAGTLLAGTLWVIGQRRSMATLAHLNRQRRRREATEAAEVTAIEERQAQLGRLNALARPTLERLAHPRPLSVDEQADCLLVEASLRDAIRARALFTEPVISAARAARARGVEVTLLDDSTERTAADVAGVVEAVAGHLDAATCGRVTARLLPPGHGSLATIVIEAEHQAMITVAPSETGE